MRQIEGPNKRQDCNMSYWHRIADEDGSTIAYCPDIVTAREIAAVPDMLSTLEFLLEDENTKFCGDTRIIIEATIQIAKGE